MMRHLALVLVAACGSSARRPVHPRGATPQVIVNHSGRTICRLWASAALGSEDSWIEVWSAKSAADCIGANASRTITLDTSALMFTASEQLDSSERIQLIGDRRPDKALELVDATNVDQKGQLQNGLPATFDKGIETK